MAASNCGSMLKRCSFKIHCRFFTLSLMGANARASRLNLACIDSAPCSVTGNLVRGNFGPGPKLSLKFLVRADQYSR